MQLPASAMDRLKATMAEIGAGHIATEAELKKKKLLPKKLSFGPDLFFSSKDRAYLVYDVGAGLLPKWVKNASIQLKPFKNTDVFILTRDSEDSPSNKVAGQIIDECIKLGFGLIAEGLDAMHVIIPPQYTL